MWSQAGTNSTRVLGMFLFAKLVLENLASQVFRDDVVAELEPETFPVDLKDASANLSVSDMEA